MILHVYVSCVVIHGVTKYYAIYHMCFLLCVVFLICVIIYSSVFVVRVQILNVYTVRVL